MLLSILPRLLPLPPRRTRAPPTPRLAPVTVPLVVVVRGTEPPGLDIRGGYGGPVTQGFVTRLTLSLFHGGYDEFCCDVVFDVGFQPFGHVVHTGVSVHRLDHCLFDLVWKN